MPSKLILDPTEPGINEVVAGAVVGQPIVLREVTAVPTVVSDATFEADITKVTVDQEEPVETMEEGEPADAGMSGMPTTNAGGFDQGAM